MPHFCMTCGHKCAVPPPKCPVCGDEHTGKMERSDGKTIYQHTDGHCVAPRP